MCVWCTTATTNCSKSLYDAAHFNELESCLNSKLDDSINEFDKKLLYEGTDICKR